MRCILTGARCSDYAEWAACSFCQQGIVISRGQLLPNWKGAPCSCFGVTPLWSIRVWSTHFCGVRPPAPANTGQEATEGRATQTTANAAWTSTLWLQSNLQERRTSVHCGHSLQSIRWGQSVRIWCNWGCLPTHIRKGMGTHQSGTGNLRSVRWAHPANKRAHPSRHKLAGITGDNKDRLAYESCRSENLPSTIFPHTRWVGCWKRCHLQRSKMRHSSCHTQGSWKSYTRCTWASQEHYAEHENLSTGRIWMPT